MYLFKNSCKNIIRNKKKYLLYMVVVGLISFISFVSIILINSSNAMIEAKKQEYGSIVSIVESNEFFSKLQSTDEKPEMPERPTTDELLAYGESDYVESVISSINMPLVINDLTMVGEMSSDEQANFGMNGAMSVNMEGTQDTNFVNPNAQLTSYADMDSLMYLKDSSAELVDGALPINENEVMISQQLAELNSLSVGDTINIGFSDKYVDMTISGIYYVDSETESTFDPSFYAANMIYMSQTSFDYYDTNVLAGTTYEQMATEQIFYKLNSYKDFDAFSKEIVDKGLSSDFELGYPTDEITSIVTPLENMKNMLFVYLGFAIIVGGLLLIFISQLNLKDRRYEIGVLRALNYPKFKLILSFLNEMVIASLIAILLSGVLSIGLSQPIADVLLTSASQETSDQGPTATQGRGGMMVTETSAGGKTYNSSGVETTAIDLLDVKISILDVLINVVCIVSLVIVSSIYGLSFIYRYRPNQILKERS